MTYGELKLIARTVSGFDKRGQPIYAENETTVLCEVVSVSRQEYFESAQVGVNPEWQFRIATSEYSGELIVEYEKKRFKIYRRYDRDDDMTELYCEFAPGVQGGVKHDN